MDVNFFSGSLENMKLSEMKRTQDKQGRSATSKQLAIHVHARCDSFSILLLLSIWFDFSRSVFATACS